MTVDVNVNVDVDWTAEVAMDADLDVDMDMDIDSTGFRVSTKLVIWQNSASAFNKKRCEYIQRRGPN